MNTEYCDRCPDEDTNRCKACDGYGNDILEKQLAKKLKEEEERIRGDEY